MVAAGSVSPVRPLSFRQRLGTVGPPDDGPDDKVSADRRTAAELRELGEYQQARELDEDALARRRRVLGDDHPDTLASASNLATDLRALGQPAESQA
jgi:Tetratricopeptide repeat